MSSMPRWGPYTPMKSLMQSGPLVIDRAEGVYVWDEAGRRYLDAHAGLWLVNVGYGRQEILDAMDRQARRLTWFSSFGGFANRPSLELAERLVDRFQPDGQAHVFFSGSGSEAVETALKIARQYWKKQGRAGKVKLIGRQHAYHGVTMGALSVAGITANRQGFEPLLAGVRHAPAPDRFHCTFHADARCNGACAREVERLIQFEGPETVAAFIAEPIQAAGGVIIPPADYLETVRDICRRYEVLFIADEVVCGFGRLGDWSGSRFYGVKPDIMTFAKGLTSGYYPVGATMVSDAIWDAFVNGPGDGGPELRHGNTYSGHPVGAAAALACLDILERENLNAAAREQGAYLSTRLQELAARFPRQVANVGNVGLLGRVELRDPDTGVPDPALGGRVQRRLMAMGIIVRPVNNIITLSPPLVIARSELDALIDGLAEALEA